MKKTTLFILPVLLLVIFVQPAHAQLKKGSWLWILNVGYVPLENKVTAESISGWTGSTTLEKLIGKSSWSIGGNLAFFNAEDDKAIINGSEAQQSFSSSAFNVGTKYYVDSMGDWVPYIGLGVGFISTTRYTSIYQSDGTVNTGSENTTNVAAVTPVGINYYVSDEVFLGLNLTTVWQDETYFKSAVNLMINLSVGFQIQ